MANKSVKRIELKQKMIQTRGTSESESIAIQFFDETGRSLVTATTFFRGQGERKEGKLIYPIIFQYEGKQVIRNSELVRNAKGYLMTAEFDKLIEAFAKLGFKAGKLKKSEDHKGYGSYDVLKIMSLESKVPIEMELGLPDSFVAWAKELAVELDNSEDA